MTDATSYEKSLQSLFSAKEKAERELDLIHNNLSLDEDPNEIEKKYDTWLNSSKKEIINIKAEIQNESSEKYKRLTRLQAKYKEIGSLFKNKEISLEDCKLKKFVIKTEFEKEKKVYENLKKLKAASTSLDVGGYIDVQPPWKEDDDLIIGEDMGDALSWDENSEQITDNKVRTDNRYEIIEPPWGEEEPVEKISRKRTEWIPEPDEYEEDFIIKYFPIIGAIIGIISVFLPWVVIDLSAFKDIPFIGQISNSISNSFSLFDIDSLIAKISEYLIKNGGSLFTNNLNSSHWIQLIIIFAITIGVSIFLNKKVRGLGIIILGVIGIWGLFGFYQEIQSVIGLLKMGGSLIDAFSNTNSVSNVLSNMISIGYGFYLEVIALVMIIGSGILGLIPEKNQKINLGFGVVIGLCLVAVILAGVIPTLLNGNTPSYQSSSQIIPTQTPGYTSSSWTSEPTPYRGIGSASNVILDGNLWGVYLYNALDSLTIHLKVPEGGEIANVRDIEFLWSCNNQVPVSVTQIHSEKEFISPGDESEIELFIPKGQKPAAGESFSLEIKPKRGSSTMISRTLSSDYSGGYIF